MTTPTIYPCRNMNMFCKHPDSGRVPFFYFLVIFGVVEFIPAPDLVVCACVHCACGGGAAILWRPPMACGHAQAGARECPSTLMDTAFSSGESRNVKQLGEASAWIL